MFKFNGGKIYAEILQQSNVMTVKILFIGKPFWDELMSKVNCYDIDIQIIF